MTIGAIFFALVLLAESSQQTVEDQQAIAQRAVEAEKRGDFSTAVSAFEQLIQSGADSPELRSNLGIAYFQLHKYDRALQQFHLVLVKAPASIPGNLFTGLCLLKLQRAREALLFLEKAARAQPDNPDIISALARAQIGSNHLDEAGPLFEKATRLDPNNAQGWYGLGIADRALAEKKLKASGGTARAQARELMDKADAALARAVKLDPDSTSAYMLMGETFRIAEQYDQAVEAYKSATAQRPDFAPVWSGLAQAYSAAGRDEDALQAANRALSLDANDASTNVLIAATYLRLGDYGKAKEYVERALLLQPDLSSAHVVVAKIDLEEQHPDKALPQLQAAVKDDVDGSTYYLLATTLRRLGRQTEAAAAMRKYKQLHAAHVGLPSNTP
ncbi:MAG TPA: tetratricopeptide repeat protein [Bryobacteraceae bacterium]|nr:tetratricopeptide repeat protein [Bryobacteraceae bacterium]